MFSLKEKQLIADKIEGLLLSLDHPEMPKDKPKFKLYVAGKEAWSWAEIKPNWAFTPENPPEINPWNEIARDLMEKTTDGGGK